MQTRKFFLIGMAALLSASLFLIGCDNPGTGTAGADGKAGSESVNGEWAVADLQAVIGDAAASGAKVRLVRVTLKDGGAIDFKNAAIQIVGPFTTADAGTVINAGNATVTFAEGAKVVLSHTVLVGEKTASPGANVSGIGKLVVAATGLPSDAAGVTAVGGVTAVKDLTLSCAAGDILSELTVYVYGKLTAPAPAATPTGKVKAIGTGEVTGNTSVIEDDKVNVSDADVTVKTGATLSVEDGKTLTVGKMLRWRAPLTRPARSPLRTARMAASRAR
jgi:hypothetical protein